MGILEKVSKVAAMLGALALIIMMSTTVLDVLLRYVTGNSILGSTEIVSYLLTAVVYFGVGYCVFEKGMITIDLFKVPLVIEYITRFLGVIVCAFIIFSVTKGAFLSMRVGGASLLISIPKWPFMLITSFGFAMMCILIILQTTEDIKANINKKHITSEVYKSKEGDLHNEY